MLYTINHIFLKPNRNKETVIQRLTEIDDRYHIEYVTMDMWKPYKVNTVLPEAKVVVDKFHVVRMVNQALDSVRKSLKETGFLTKAITFDFIKRRPSGRLFCLDGLGFWFVKKWTYLSLSIVYYRNRGERDGES